MPQVVMGMFTSDSENRRTVYRRVKVMMPVSVLRNAKQNVVSVEHAHAHERQHARPCLSNRRPAMAPWHP